LVGALQRARSGATRGDPDRTHGASAQDPCWTGGVCAAQADRQPVFGIIKSVMGFRQFLTRGLQNVQGERTLVCLAWNLKRMAVLRP
jgi:hypothetical protein